MMSEDIKDVKKTATKGKTTTRKTTTKKQIEEPEVDYKSMFEMLQKQMEELQKQLGNSTELKKEEIKLTSDEKWTKAKLYSIKDELVEVRNVIDSEVGYLSPKTKVFYSWLEKGDKEVLTIEEVLSMNTKRKFLQTPWLVVEDDRVNEALGLTKIVEIAEKIEDINSLVEMELNDLEDLISNLSKEQTLYLRDEINKKIENNEIRDYVTVVTLKKILNLD